MSIPPSQPGDHYAPLRPSGVSGWKIAGFGCLALFLLAAVGGVLLVRTVKDRINHPSKNDVMGVAIIAGKAGMDGARLRQAIIAYHQEKGRYPQSLMDLVAESRIDGKMLHNDLDDNPNPGHVSWRYTKPAEGAPGDTPILEEPYKITMGGNSQSSNIVITLDGRNRAGVSSQGQTPGGRTP